MLGMVNYPLPCTLNKTGELYLSWISKKKLVLERLMGAERNVYI